MGKYGSKTDHEGKVINAQGSMPIITGPCVAGHTIEYFGMSKDQNGELQDNIAEVRFRQSNGALFVKKFWDSDQDWAITNLNRDILHICTKIVSEQEYYQIVEAAGDTFTDFINAINTHIISKAADMKFSLKIVWKENKNENSQSFGQFFPSLPPFPNWIEVDGTSPSTFKTNPQYDFYEKPEATSTEDLEDTVADTGSTEDIF